VKKRAREKKGRDFGDFSKEALVATLHAWERARCFFPVSKERFLGLCALKEMEAAANKTRVAADALTSASDRARELIQGQRVVSGRVRVTAKMNAALESVERARRAYDRGLARFERAKRMEKECRNEGV
jgi:hypothetical protein